MFALLLFPSKSCYNIKEMISWFRNILVLFFFFLVSLLIFLFIQRTNHGTHSWMQLFENVVKLVQSDEEVQEKVKKETSDVECDWEQYRRYCSWRDFFRWWEQFGVSRHNDDSITCLNKAIEEAFGVKIVD